MENKKALAETAALFLYVIPNQGGNGASDET